jgi:putative ABC transport system permease protein
MIFKSILLILRNMRSDSVYTGIKLLGLGIGIASAFVSMLLIRDDFSYNRFFSRPDNLYRISSIAGETPRYYSLTPSDLAGWLKLEYPDLIDVTRLYGEVLGIRKGTTEITESAYSVDQNIFDILDFKFIAGDSKKSLDQPNSVVMTASKAQKIFGTDQAIGLDFENIQSPEHEILRVTGILADIPNNTHLDSEIFVSSASEASALHQMDIAHIPAGALNLVVETYARLNPGISKDRLSLALQSIVNAHYRPDGPTESGLKLSADPMMDIHLDPHGLSGRHGSDVNTVVAIGFLGVMLLAIAIINYSSLVTAKASNRLIEIGVRKSVGATRRDIAIQIFLESAVFTSFGLLLGIGLVELTLGDLNTLLDRKLDLDFVHDGMLDGLILVLFILVSLCGGAYPAGMFSALKPSVALKRGRNLRITGPSLLQILVVIQFTIGIGMIIGTGVIYQQRLFVTNSGLKFDTDEVLLVKTHLGCADAFKQELASRRGILAVACSRAAPLDFESSASDANLPDGRKIRVERQPVDFGFFDLYQLPLRAGRDFSRDHLATDQVSSEDGATMTASVVINETAARAFGFEPVASAVGQVISVEHVHGELGKSMIAGESTIIGVVADFPVRSAQFAILPMAFYVDPAPFALLSVKLKRDDIMAGVASVDAVWHEMGPDRLIERFFLETKIQERYSTLIAEQDIFLILSGLGIVVACIGLFGLAGYAAQTRTKEIGIRKALGATTPQLVRLLVWQFIRPVIVANLIAWPIAGWLLQRWLEGFALRIDLNPLIFLGAGSIAIVVAFIVTAGHAIKIASAQPITALHYE